MEGAPDLHVPLAQPAEVLGALDIAPKLDRLPDETLVEVRRFAVTLLESRDDAPPAQSRQFAGIFEEPDDDCGGGEPGASKSNLAK